DVAAAGLAPDELALSDLEALDRALLVDQPAFEHVGLLDLDVLVVGQHAARGKAHQRGDEAGRLVEQQRLRLAAGKTRLLPFHLGRAHDRRMLGLRGDGIHGVLLTGVGAMLADCAGACTPAAARPYSPPPRIGGWNASPVSQGKKIQVSCDTSVMKVS